MWKKILTTSLALTIIAGSVGTFSEIPVLRQFDTSIVAEASSGFTSSQIGHVILLVDDNHPATLNNGHTALVLVDNWGYARYYSFGSFGGSSVSTDTISHATLVGRMRGGSFWESEKSKFSEKYDRFCIFAVSTTQGSQIYQHCEKMKKEPKKYNLLTNYTCDGFVAEALWAAKISYSSTLWSPKTSFNNFKSANNGLLKNSGNLGSGFSDLFLPPVSSTRYVTASSLNVRSQPWVGGEKVGSFSKGAKVQVLGTVINGSGEHWVRIRYNGNDWRYVHAMYLRF